MNGQGVSGFVNPVMIVNNTKASINQPAAVQRAGPVNWAHTQVQQRWQKHDSSILDIARRHNSPDKGKMVDFTF